MKPVLSDEWIPWFVDIYINNRDELVDILNKHNIKTRPTYGELNQTDMYKGDILVNSHYVSTHGLFTPGWQGSCWRWKLWLIGLTKRGS